MTGALHKVTMPKWGLSMKAGTVIEWLVDEGAAVEAGEEIAEIETEKVNNAFEAPASGVLRRHVAAAGATLPVGGLMAVIADADVGDEAIDALIAEFAQTFVPEPDDEVAAMPETVTLDGRAVSYLSAGDATAGATPLLLVHGFAGDVSSWLFTQAPLAVARRVIALDLPGHGASDKFVGEDAVAYLADAVIGLLDSLKIARAHLAGHSLGGAVVAQVCARRPELVASLTLIAPAGVGADINGEAIGALVAAERRRGAREALQAMVADPDLVSREMVERFLRFKRTDGVAAALARLAGALCDGDRQRVDISAQLANVGVPLLAIWGEADGVIPAAQADHLPAAATVHRIAGAGHLVHMEAASEVTAAIAEFLRQADG